MVDNRRLLKYGTFLICWVLSICILLVISANNELNTLYHRAESHDFDLTLPRNEMGAVGYTRCDPQNNHRPIYSIHFNKLLAENNRLGIFKTGLHKVVKIQSLVARFYQYTSPIVKPATKFDHNKSLKTTEASPSKPCISAVPDFPLIPEGKANDVQALIKVIDKLINPKDGWRINIDLSNISEVLVNSFDYKVFRDGDLFLSIQSKRAIASYKHSGLVLRGHVTIKTADGSTLESNCVKWDLENQLFNVNGVYVLNHNGVITAGKNICVDSQLNNIKVQHAKFKLKEKRECFAKL